MKNIFFSLLLIVATLPISKVVFAQDSTLKATMEWITNRIEGSICRIEDDLGSFRQTEERMFRVVNSATNLYLFTEYFMSIDADKKRLETIVTKGAFSLSDIKEVVVLNPRKTIGSSPSPTRRTSCWSIKLIAEGDVIEKFRTGGRVEKSRELQIMISTSSMAFDVKRAFEHAFTLVTKDESF